MEETKKLPVDTVIFDFDNTLVNTKQAVDDAYAKVFRLLSAKHKISLETLGREMNRIESQMTQGVDRAKENYDRKEYFRILSNKLGIPISESEIDTYSDVFNSAIKDAAFFPRYTSEVISELKKRGKKLGILTEKDPFLPGLKQKRLEKLPCIHDFEFVVIAGETILESKTSPAAFTKTLELFNLDASKTLFVGNRLDIDVENAKKAGMIAALVTTYPEDPRRSEYKPDYVFSDIRGVIDIL